jgi:hypothetical protein
MYRVRYNSGAGPDDSDVLEIEAAMFVSKEEFVDFYTHASQFSGGTYGPSGKIVLRVRGDLICDIRALDL